MARALDQRAEDGGIVHHRLGIRHRDHRAVSARCRRRGAAVEILLVFLAGYAQMHVRVDERRERVLAGRVEHVAVFGGGKRSGLSQLRDDARADQDVADLVDLRARVEDVRAAHQQLGGGLGTAEQPRTVHHATA